MASAAVGAVRTGRHVAGHRGTDVPALDVENGQVPGRVGPPGPPRETAMPGAAMTLSGLGLTAAARVTNHGDGPAGRSPAGLPKSARPQASEQVRVGVDADAQGPRGRPWRQPSGLRKGVDCLVSGGWNSSGLPCRQQGRQGGTRMPSLAGIGGRRCAPGAARTRKGPRSWASGAWTAAWKLLDGDDGARSAPVVAQME